MNRLTPENITELAPHEISTFASNEMGIHGAGAAKQAVRWGAVKHVGFGLRGQTFAIPTKGPTWRTTLPLSKIGYYVQRYIDVVAAYPHLTFLTTAIGCGLAGYNPAQIAPLFLNAVPVANIYLPESFWKILQP